MMANGIGANCKIANVSSGVEDVMADKILDYSLHQNKRVDKRTEYDLRLSCAGKLAAAG